MTAAGARQREDKAEAKLWWWSTAEMSQDPGDEPAAAITPRWKGISVNVT